MPYVPPPTSLATNRRQVTCGPLTSNTTHRHPATCDSPRSTCRSIYPSACFPITCLSPYVPTNRHAYLHPACLPVCLRAWLRWVTCDPPTTESTLHTSNNVTCHATNHHEVTCDPLNPHQVTCDPLMPYAPPPASSLATNRHRVTCDPLTTNTTHHHQVTCDPPRSTCRPTYPSACLPALLPLPLYIPTNRPAYLPPPCLPALPIEPLAHPRPQSHPLNLITTHGSNQKNTFPTNVNKCPARMNHMQKHNHNFQSELQ